MTLRKDLGVINLGGFRFSIPVLIAISALTLVACSSSESVSGTAVPTNELVIPTKTPFPPTPTPTPTPIPVIRAASLSQEIPSSLADLEDEAERDIAIQVFETLTVQRVNQGLIGDLRLLQLEHAMWSNNRLLGCPKTSEASEVPGFRVVFASDNLIYEYHTGLDNEIRFCRVRDVSDAEDEQLLLVDFVAAELFSLVQQRISRERDIPSSRVKLESMSRVTWPDANLGCVPLETAVPIQPIAVDGYRFVVSVGDEQIIFHADFESIRQCAAVDEVLPNDIENSTATPVSVSNP